MVTKPSQPVHFDQTQPRLAFTAAYKAITSSPGRVYYTVGNGAAFTATAQSAVRGAHAGDKVIVFRKDGKERARVYKCCWEHRTNCNRTYVDCYVLAL